MNRSAELPEKVLQFGTGMLLRGLPDYFIDKANQQNVFNGRILAVKSTPGSVREFADRHCHFTTFVRGIENGKPVEEDLTNTAISRVITATDDWQEVLKAARSPGLQIIISNTTEVGLQFVDESVFEIPPISFPAKLTAFLYERFLRLGTKSPATIVIPTELIPANGEELKLIVHQLIACNGLENGFLEWLEEKVIFCNSLVDRIVTLPSKQVMSSLSQSDPKAIQTEPYRLWAIEGDERVKAVLTFATADPGVIIANNINFYRERKLRLLNGTHTLSVCLGFMKGFNTVLECMDNQEMRSFIENMMMNEILPTLPTGNIDDNSQFAREVLDRFHNPWSEHRLLNITWQSTAKMKMRNIPTLLRYGEKFGKTPDLMARGFAAYLLFMRSEKKDIQFLGRRDGESYLIQDEFAGYFCEKWKIRELKKLVAEVIGNAELWGANLNQIPGFEEAVGVHLESLAHEA